MLRKNFLPYLALALAVLPACPLVAQQITPQTTEGQIERSRLPNPALPLAPSSLSIGQPVENDNTLPDARAVETPGDSDLGVQSLLRAPERPTPWMIFADGGFIYTTNVALTHHNVQDDFFYVGEGGVSFEKKLGQDLNFAATAREQYFAYDRFDQLDFGSLGVALALSYTARQLDNIVFTGQLGLTRLTHKGLFDDEFYRSVNFALGGQKILAINRAQIISLGVDTDLGISLPHSAEREEFGFSVGYIIQATRHLSLQTGGRAAYFLYPSTGRQDFNASGSAGLTYAFTPWCSVGATLSGTIDRSDRAIFDYSVLNTGASVFFRLRF